jgi:hypothetical protein
MLRVDEPDMNMAPPIDEYPFRNVLSVIFISTPMIRWMKVPWVWRFFRSPFGIKLS